MEKTSQLELESLITKLQGGEDLNKRSSRADSLEAYFRRRNELMKKFSELQWRKTG